MAPIVRASWLRGVSALPSSFAHESYIDELRDARRGVDPVPFRLRHLHDPRAGRAGAGHGAEGRLAHAHRAYRRTPTAGSGRPAATSCSARASPYARYVHSKWPSFGAVLGRLGGRRGGQPQDGRGACAARGGGARRGADDQSGGRRAPGARQRGPDHQPRAQGAGAVRAATGCGRRRTACTAVLPWRAWWPAASGAAPDPQLPRSAGDRGACTMPRPGEPSLGAGESSSVPGTAAIANAIFDATGVRFGRRRFTPEAVLAESGSVARCPLWERARVVARGAGWRCRQCRRARSPTFPRGGGAMADAPWPARKGCGPPAPLRGRAASASSPACSAGARPSRRSSLSAPVYSEATHRTRPRSSPRARRLRGVPHRARRRGQRRRGRPRRRRFGTRLRHQPHARCRDRPRPLVLQRLPARAMREGVSRDGHCAVSRPFRTPPSPRPATTTCRRSTPTSCRSRRCMRRHADVRS